MIRAKVTPVQYEGLKEMLAAEGYLISGNSGVIAADGSRAEVRYDGTANLTVAVTHTPFLVPQSLVEGRIADGLRQKGVECTVAG